MGESDLHRRLKRAGADWLWRSGYAAIAEEVSVRGVGIIDVVSAGKWKKPNPRTLTFERVPPVDRHHVVFIECKAFRADFVRDLGRQQQFSFAVRETSSRLRAGRRGKPQHASSALGKFDTCLVRPHANLHYVLTPLGLLKKMEVPRRWGWLVLDRGQVCVRKRAAWQEEARTSEIEGAIARSLTTRRMGVFAADRAGAAIVHITPDAAAG